MGWEQRGAFKYYYRKERDGSRVKSVYVGRGEIAHMISQIQASSSLLEKLAAASEAEADKSEAVLDQASELVLLFTQAALLMAGFHTHKRQWRKIRDVASD